MPAATPGTEHEAREQRLGQEAGGDRVEGVALAEERGGKRKQRAGDEDRDERAREQPAAAAVRVLATSTRRVA